MLVGKVRAKQYYSDDFDRTRNLGVLLHGDGSFSGQGVVYETLDMSALQGLHCGRHHPHCGQQPGSPLPLQLLLHSQLTSLTRNMPIITLWAALFTSWVYQQGSTRLLSQSQLISPHQ